MGKIFATYSPCCAIFHLGEAEPGVMHCALPHQKDVVRLVDEKRIEALEAIIDNLQAQAVFYITGSGGDECKAWVHIPKEEWDASMARSKH